MSTELRASYTHTFKHAFDVKGRITVPADWRTEFHEAHLFVLPSSEACVRVYPASWMSELQAGIKGRIDSDPVRQQVQALATIAQGTTWDQQGRIIVKDALRKRAGLSKDSMLVGKLGHFEIWDNAAWEKKQPVELTVEEALRAMGL